MKQVICLSDGSWIEIDGSNVKHISKDDNILYDSTKAYVNQGGILMCLMKKRKLKRESMRVVCKHCKAVSKITSKDIEKKSWHSPIIGCDPFIYKFTCSCCNRKTSVYYSRMPSAIKYDLDNR